MVLAILFALPSLAYADRIGDIVESSFGSRAWRFFSFQEPSLRYALAGSIMIGLSCGLMGSFLVVRKLALMGDALSHAVLPGVAFGFMWNMTKSPVAIFIGATIAGLLGAATVQLLRQTTRHKEDALLGFVLASFFAVGICLMTMIQGMPGAQKSGLDSFMFGQAASMGEGDVLLLGIVTLLCVAMVVVYFKEYKLTSFDPGFARSIGLYPTLFHYSLMLLLAFAIVSSLQAVGVVLVSAMLVIPAATAYLLTDRLGIMLTLSAVFGMLCGSTGAFVSYSARNLPTGPLMVLAAALVFLLALFLAPRHGIAVRWWRHRSRTARIRRENTLKAVYRILETRSLEMRQVGGESVSIIELARERRVAEPEARAEAKALVRFHFATFSGNGVEVTLTPEGWKRACEIVRNHRLWELYLTNAAHFAPDHVHEDAEVIEHVLGEATVRQLERRLNFATRDPHGKLIPGVEDIHGQDAANGTAPIPQTTGYGQNRT